MDGNPPDKYAPLSADELSATQIDAPTAHDDGELVSPVPHDAPPAPAVHFKFGEPTARWEYRDATGALLLYVLRFDPPEARKEFWPLTLWRMADGALRWRWKNTPAPRAIYGLDKLAANADAPVIIAEGEKAADAAALIFGKSIAVTSPGGSGAEAHADWSTLSGRRVLIWPDADMPGAKYATAVAETLHRLGCEVSIIDAVAFASRAPDGSEREPKKGWDAFDAIEEWQDMAALRRIAVSFAKTYMPGPLYVSCGDYEMDGKKGLTTEVEKGRGDNKTVETLWISAPFEILGASRDPHGHGWGKWIRWRDGDRREHLRHVSDSALQGEPASLCAMLADEGLLINRNSQRNFATYLSTVRTKGRVTIVNRTGWHMIGGRDVFVLPHETIGPRGSESVILDAAAIGPYEARGALVDWQNGAGAMSSGHALPVLAISAGLAGPLLHLAGQEGGGLNFFGPSSRGKTTLLQLAASVWGRGGSPGYLRAWRATANGLEGAAASATDTCLVLDEFGQVEARDAAAALYSLANGTGKARAARDGALREPKSWRALILSSGEIPTETKLGEDRSRKARAGQLVRLLDVPADRGFDFGAFDHAGPAGDAASLAKSFKTAATSAYGTAGPAFVGKLIADDVTGEDVRALVSEFVRAEIPTGGDGQIDRAAQRLGLIAAAGELACLLGVAPWKRGEARAAAAWALGQWIAGRGGTEPAEVRQAIAQVRLAIEQHGESRFEAIDVDEARPVLNRLGWRKGSGADREWWIPSEVWKSEVCSGLDSTFVAKTLSERGLLRTQGGRGLQCKVNLGGDRRAWAYVLTASILDGGDNAP